MYLYHKFHLILDLSLDPPALGKCPVWRGLLADSSLAGRAVKIYPRNQQVRKLRTAPWARAEVAFVGSMCARRQPPSRPIRGPAPCACDGNRQPPPLLRRCAG